jgi:hypothetical protein
LAVEAIHLRKLLHYWQSAAVHVEVAGNAVQVFFCIQLAAVEYRH